MRIHRLIIGFTVLAALTACNTTNPQQKVSYADFYAKVMEIEDHQYTKLTYNVEFYIDFTESGQDYKEESTETANFTWNAEREAFVNDEDPTKILENDVNFTLKDLYGEYPEESSSSKEYGTEYYLNPFRVYLDVTENIEERTIRTITEDIYNEYGYVTYHRFEASAEGTYKGEPLSGVQRYVYYVTYLA